jgi:hypothetical protein
MTDPLATTDRRSPAELAAVLPTNVSPTLL